MTVNAIDRKSPTHRPLAGHVLQADRGDLPVQGLHAEKVKVPASSTRPNTDMTKKDIVAKEFPLSWYRAYGKGRVFYTALGHRPECGRRALPDDQNGEGDQVGNGRSEVNGL